jgi:murein DD-endopeptidase MepM/ murein hydrolase activator NlpD
MNRIPLKAVFLITVCLVFSGLFGLGTQTEEPPSLQHPTGREIKGEIKKGETLFDIFKKYNLEIGELYRIHQASAGLYKLRELYPGRSYKIVLDSQERIDSFRYRIDDDCYLSVNRNTDGGYCAEKVLIHYEKRILHIGGTIRENLIASLEGGNENLLLALQLSDIFAWDIDFTTDLREEDTFRVVVEGLYLDGKFKKYGDILSAEFINTGDVYRAYAFAQNGKIDYYDEKGKLLRKPFLKTPLSFRCISSGFSGGRYHPILKIYRPHHGLDYAAATGTPVSAAGDGEVLFAGRRGDYGNLVVLKHKNGYKTYYGHLSKIGKGVRSGGMVDQGSVIGYVGATGLATGPHLHYEMRINDRPINPLSLKVPPGAPISAGMWTAFRQFTDRMNSELASVKVSNRIAAGAVGEPGSRKEG